MSVSEYKEAIKTLLDSTDDEALLKHWKHQLEWDLENRGAFNLSKEEWNLVEEGLAEYKKGEVISFEDFMSRRND